MIYALVADVLALVLIDFVKVVVFVVAAGVFHIYCFNKLIANASVVVVGQTLAFLVSLSVASGSGDNLLNVETLAHSKRHLPRRGAKKQGKDFVVAGVAALLLASCLSEKFMLEI